MQGKKSNFISPDIVGFIMVVVIIIGIWFYNSYIMHKVSNTMDETLDEIVTQQAFNFTTKITSEMAAMKMLATSIASIERTDDIPIETLSHVADISSFEYLSIVDMEGNATYSNGDTANINDREYFHKALAGETILSEPTLSKIRNFEVMVLATPVVYKGEIVGVLTGSYLAGELHKLFLDSFGGLGYAYVVTNEGKIIAKTTNSYSLTKSNNLFDTYKEAVFYSGDDFAEIKNKIYSNESGVAKYKVKEQKRIVHYMPIGVNGWYIFSIAPEAIVSKNAQEITYATLLLSVIFVVLFILLIVDIVKIQEQNMENIRRIAFVDELTGAPTLVKFKLDAQEVLDTYSDQDFLLVKFDIDKFKLVNQMYGYSVGDKLLCALVKSLQGNLGSTHDIYARLNVDEFIVLHRIIPQDAFHGNRDNFLGRIPEFMGPDFNFNLKVPAGHFYIQANADRRDISDALEKVNFAHKQSKLSGLEVCNYNDDLAASILHQKEIENKMELALEQNQFHVFLQAKYYLAQERMAGAEALVRWKDGDTDIVYPGIFIPLFEENGFITKLDMYMFEKVCKIIKGWMDSGVTPIVVSVNFSRNHLANPEFVNTLCYIANTYGVPHQYLEIELTESTIFHNEGILIEVLEHLHREGFTLSMDDFGTGYSSLGLLKNIPVDVIKIDRSFFSTADAVRAKIVIANVMKMAGELGIKTVAEGVETLEHIILLRELGCNIVQGYYYAKPIPASVFTEEIKKAQEHSPNERVSIVEAASKNG